MPGRGVPRAVVGAVIQAHPAFFHREGERGGVAHVRHGELDRAVPAGAEHCAFAVHIHNFIAVFTHQMELDAAAPLYREGRAGAAERPVQPDRQTRHSSAAIKRLPPISASPPLWLAFARFSGLAPIIPG